MRFSITLTQLAYFVECASTLNMTEASQRLLVAQSAVSTAMAQLERNLGVTLFIRKHSKGLVLTPAGETLLGDTRRLFSMLSNSIEAVKASQGEVCGTIRLACFTTLAPFVLVPLIRNLKERHPNLEIEVSEGNDADIQEALLAGRIELGIGYHLTDLPGIHTDRVGGVRPYVVLPANHRLASNSVIDLDELADEPFVLLDMPGSREYFLGLLRQAGVSPRLRYQASSYETVRSMVGAGLGYSVLNQRPLVSRSYAGDEVVFRPTTSELPGLDVVVTSLAQVEPSARVQAVVDEVRQVIEERERMRG